MKIQHLTAADAFASLKSRASGLDDAEAARRLAGFGKNQVEEIAREPLILTFAREFVHFFAIILWIAAALAFFAEWNQPGQGMATLGFAIIGVIVINGVFSFWQAYRAEQALAVLKKLLPHSTRVLRSGNVRQIAAAELAPGGVILLEGGDILPADCRLVEAFGVRVNNATITGTQLGHLTNIQLQLALDAPEILFARVQAEQKMRIVAALKKKNEIVAVTGDGVNDAPALRKAHVGTAPIARSVWLFIVPFAIAMVVLEEFRKWLRRSSLTREPPMAKAPCMKPIFGRFPVEETKRTHHLTNYGRKHLNENQTQGATPRGQQIHPHSRGRVAPAGGSPDPRTRQLRGDFRL